MISLEQAVRNVVERHIARPCADSGKGCSICELAVVMAERGDTEPAPAHEKWTGAQIVAFIEERGGLQFQDEYLHEIGIDLDEPSRGDES